MPWRRRAKRSPMSATIAPRPRCMSGICSAIMMLHWLQQSGNKPIALMGGGTTRVGDPSGRDETRKLLTVEQIDANKEIDQGHVYEVPALRRHKAATR